MPSQNCTKLLRQNRKEAGMTGMASEKIPTTILCSFDRNQTPKWWGIWKPCIKCWVWNQSQKISEVFNFHHEIDGSKKFELSLRDHSGRLLIIKNDQPLTNFLAAQECNGSISTSFVILFGITERPPQCSGGTLSFWSWRALVGFRGLPVALSFHRSPAGGTFIARGNRFFGRF